MFIASDAYNILIRRGCISQRSTELFFRLLDDELQNFHPNVFMTYGGWPQLATAAEHAKMIGAAPVFFLHNLNYKTPELLKEFSAVVVPSDFAKNSYKQKLIDAVGIPPVIEEKKIIVPENIKEQQFVTFINPTRAKGRQFFIGIVRDINKKNEKIPFLIVNARENAEILGNSYAGRSLKNLRFFLTSTILGNSMRVPKSSYFRHYAKNRSGGSPLKRV